MASQDKDLQRVETFSDGVFAIAVTLLILEIKVPSKEEIESAGLLKGLINEWPSYLAYFVSFGSILVTWMNHHRTSKLLVRCSKTYLFGNGILLLTVTFIPYPTAVLASYINSPDQNIAVMFYSFAYLLSNLGFLIWWYTIRYPIYLLDPTIPKTHVNKLTIQTFSGFIVYFIATIISYWFPTVGLIMIFSLYALWVGMSVGGKD